MFTWPLFAWIIWRMSRRWSGYLAVVLGLLPWALADVLLSWWTLDDPWAKWHVLTGSDLNDSTSVLDGAYLGHQRWWYISRLPIAHGTGAVGLDAVADRRSGHRRWAGSARPGGTVRRLGRAARHSAGPAGRGAGSEQSERAGGCAAVLAGLHARLDDRRGRAVRCGGGPAAVAGLRRCRCAGPACGDQRARFVATEPTFYPTSGDLPYRTVQALPDDATVWTDGRTYRILPIYANSADRTVDVRDFTRRGAKPAAGDYVLIFSDTDGPASSANWITTCGSSRARPCRWLTTSWCGRRPTEGAVVPGAVRHDPGAAHRRRRCVHRLMSHVVHGRTDPRRRAPVARRVHKTGTTALQAALADARAQLVEHGVLYPGEGTFQHRAIWRRRAQVRLAGRRARRRCPRSTGRNSSSRRATTAGL